MIPQRTFLLSVLAVLFLCSVLRSGAWQAPPYQITGSAMNPSWGPVMNLGSSNPAALPGPPQDMNVLALSSRCLAGILPSIPNFQAAYIYTFGNQVRSGRLTLDYLLPVNLDCNTAVFAETHSEWQSYWNTLPGSPNNRVDISVGAGWRKIIRDTTFVGVNGFFDTARISGSWYQTGSAGFEWAELVGGCDLIDLNFNWYGELFEGSVLLDAFRYGPSNFDIEAGYSHELYEGGPDLRLKFTGYEQDIGTSVYGLNTGAELFSHNGVCMVKYEYGRDKVNGDYQSVGAYVNLGFQLERLLNGELPVTLPDPIFHSPRNLRRLLSQPVKRSTCRQWAGVASSSGEVQAAAARPVIVRIGNPQVILLTDVNGGFPKFANFTEPPVTNAELRATTNTRITLTITSPTGFTFNNNTLVVGIRDNGHDVNVGVDAAHAIPPNTPVGTTPMTTTFVFNDPNAAQTLAAAGGGTGICDVVFLAGVFGPVSTTPPIMYWQATVEFFQ